MEIRKWLEKNDAPDHMPNIDVIYSAGAKHIDVTFDPDIEDEEEDEEGEGEISEIVLDVTLPDDMEKQIDVMVAMAYVMQDTSKIKRLSARVVQLTTYSPYDRYVFDDKKVWSKPDVEEEE